MSNTTRPGLFLALEGVEGSGKTTQASRLAEHLRARGVPVVVAREPGSTVLGERIRATVLGDVELTVPARSELFLMLAARASFVEQVVLPALRTGSVVIADRFELSTLAYQGAGRGLPLDEVRRCNHFATGGVRPALTVLLELPPEEGARRQRAAGKLPDRMERETAEFHQRVARGYAALAGEIEGIARLDADAPPAVVHARLCSLLAARFPETFGPGGVSNIEPPDSTPEPGSSFSRVASEGE